MNGLMECRQCRGLVDEGESCCSQCGSALFRDVGSEHQQLLAVKQQQVAFTATFSTLTPGCRNGVELDMGRGRMAVHYDGGSCRCRKIIQGHEIIGVKVAEAAGSTHTKTNRGSQLGGALLGGVMLGGVGALLGGLSAKQTSTGTVASIEVLITTVVPHFQLVTIPLLMGEHRTDSSIVAQCRRAAEVWVARVEAVRSQGSREMTQVSAGPGGSVADELGKLVWLRDHGEITAQEYELLKGRLLGNVSLR